MSEPMPRWQLAAVSAGMVVIVLSRLRRTRSLARETADSMEAQLDELDPVTRVATVALMTHDASAKARDQAKS